MNVKIANQKTGVISTPKAGGIFPFASLRRGSDGHATTAQGNSFSFVSGYQDATTRHSYGQCRNGIERRGATDSRCEKSLNFVVAVVFREKKAFRKRQPDD